MTDRPKTHEPAVMYQASYQRLDGTGWDHLAITLPPGATDEQIAEAIATWQRIKTQALPALIANPSMTTAAPSDPIGESHRLSIGAEARKIKLGFGTAAAPTAKSTPLTRSISTGSRAKAVTTTTASAPRP